MNDTGRLLGSFTDSWLAEERHAEALKAHSASKATAGELNELRRRLYIAKATAEGYRDLAFAIIDEIGDVDKGKRVERRLSDPRNRDKRNQYLNERENVHVRRISGGRISKIDR